METKYQAVYRNLKKYLAGLPDGTKLPPFTELCAKYSISQASLSSALDLLEKDGLVRRIHRSGVFSVKDPASLKPLKITLLMPGEQDTLFVALITACHHFCSAHRIQLQFEFSGLDLNQECEALNAVLTDDSCCGLLFMPLYPHFPRQMCERSLRLLKKIAAKKPVVQFDRQLNGFSFVGYDDHHAYSGLVQYLRGQGHRFIGLICAQNDNLEEPPERIQAFFDVLREWNMVCPAEHIIRYDAFSDSHPSNALEVLQRPDCPTAFVGINAVYLPRFFHCAGLAGKRVPEDVAVCCYDLDSVVKALPFKVPYYSEPAREVMTQAAQQLLDEIKAVSPAGTVIRLKGNVCCP
ncbi:MAG: GntR family transcriptional regulator [Lentisphaeria bacterium]|nr:GntR family transcriptional regulator [Lentisphaeria bacterium]